MCVSKLAIIGLNKGSSPFRCQAIIKTSAGLMLLLIGPLGTNVCEIIIIVKQFWSKKVNYYASHMRHHMHACAMYVKYVVCRCV